MKSESGRMKGDSNGEDEKMRAENGRIKGDQGAYEGVGVEYHRPLFPVTEKKRGPSPR